MNDKQLTERINILADMLHAKGLSKIELSEGDFKVSIEYSNNETFANLRNNKNEQPPMKVEKISNGNINIYKKSEAHKIASPIVGTVYLSSNVGQEPFVKCGSIVKKGQKICVLESMKMFSDLLADKDGIIESVNVANGQVVGVGDTLFTITLLANGSNISENISSNVSATFENVYSTGGNF